MSELLELMDTPNELKIEERIVRFSSGEKKVVMVLVDPGRKSVTERDKEWLLGVGKDLGKWEDLVTGFGILANEIGLSANYKKYKKKVRPDYSLKILERTIFLDMRICLMEIMIPKHESLTTGELDSDFENVLMQDVFAEAQNVEKWRSIVRSKNILQDLFKGAGWITQFHVS